MSKYKYRKQQQHLLQIQMPIFPYYFNILFANKADEAVNTNPKKATIHMTIFSTSDSKGKIILITNPAKESFDKSKKYPASFSLLTLSFSLPSRFSSCFLSQFPTQSDFQLFIHFGKRPKVKQCLCTHICVHNCCFILKYAYICNVVLKVFQITLQSK